MLNCSKDTFLLSRRSLLFPRLGNRLLLIPKAAGLLASSLYLGSKYNPSNMIYAINTVSCILCNICYVYYPGLLKGPGTLSESSWIFRQNFCKLTPVSVLNFLDSLTNLILGNRLWNIFLKNTCMVY